MRPSPALRRLAALGALAWTARAGADLNASANASYGYARQDTEIPGGTHLSGDWQDWGLTLSLDGTPFRPGLLSWGASGSYGQHRSIYGGSTEGRDGLGYGLSLSLLDSQPVGLSLSASRARTEFTQRGDGATSGTTTGGSETASLTLAFPGAPRLYGMLSHTEMSNRGFGRGDVTDEALQLRTVAADRVGPLHYQLEYDTGWNSGTFAETNYHSHSVTMSATSSRPDQQLSFAGSYLLRLPTVDSPLNPRFDDDTLSGAVSWQWGEKLHPAVSYAYQRALISAPGSPAREGTSNQLTQSLEYRYQPTLRFSQSLSATYVSQRLGPGQVDTASEAMGGAVSWLVPISTGTESAYTLNLGAGASAGMVQGAGVDRVSGYGFSGTASLNRASSSGAAQLAYSFAYADNLTAAEERRFTQDLRLEADTASTSRLRLRLSLVGRSERQSSPLLGSSADRSITASALGTLDTWVTSLSAGLSDGLSPGLRDLGLADGLIWAPAYDWHSQFVSLSSSTGFGHLSLTGVANYVHSSGPGRPDDHELGLSAVAGYAVGLFTISAEDRFSTGGAGGVTRSGNLFMVRLSRSFGWHFR